VVPSQGGDRGDPLTDFDGSGQCFVTGNAVDEDLDGGPTEILSPVFDATGVDNPQLTYARWFTNDDNDIDSLDIDLSNDGGATWTPVESVGSSFGWTEVRHRISDFVTPTDQMRLRVQAADQPNDSVTEAAFDAVSVSALTCRPLCVDGSGGYTACGPVPVDP